MKYKTLYQELANSTEMIRSLLADVSQEEAQYKPSRSTWSILEVTCHLYDEEREDFREHLDFIISTSLNASLHRQGKDEWHSIAPFAWVKLRKYNQQNFKTIQRKFFNEREKSLAWLRSLKNTDWDITYQSQWGIMRAGDMLASWVAHDNLHVRQLTELRRARIERIAKPYYIQYAGDW